MMALDKKQLSDAEALTSDRQTMRLDAARALSRRSQALLAAAGESEPVTRRWYVLTVAGGADIPVDNALTNAGVEHWMAVEKLTSKWRGGRKHQRFCASVKPIFKGYIFVNVAWSEMTWRGLSSIDGVEGIVGGAICPAPLAQKEFDRFRWRVDNDPKFLKALRNALEPGASVRVEEGPFASFPGVVLELFEKTARVTVEVDIFGRRVPVDLELAQIRKVE